MFRSWGRRPLFSLRVYLLGLKLLRSPAPGRGTTGDDRLWHTEGVTRRATVALAAGAGAYVTFVLSAPPSWRPHLPLSDADRVVLPAV
jgi:hypothetical protein